MNDKSLHKRNLAEKSEDFFSKGKIEWKHSDSDIWAKLESQISEPVKLEPKYKPQYEKIAAAALILFLISFSVLTNFYSKTISCLPGETLVTELPDGSKVSLNSASQIKYKPVKWNFSRQIEFEGEGFFDVKKGETFEVISENGTTQVLGTSFNIFARNDQYRVTCVSGKVKVVSNSLKTVTLLPNNSVELSDGDLIVSNKRKPENVVSWTNNRFSFSGTSLKEVFDEIERRYAITIRVEENLLDRNLTMNFNKKPKVEDVLEYICLSMEIKFVKQSENEFLIVEKS